jgi:hypothetical protein
MRIPPLFKQLYQKHKELREQFRLMKIVIIPRNYTLENLVALNDTEKILHEMLNLIEEIKQSHTRQPRGQRLPGDPQGN